MSETTINGARLYYELTGVGPEPMVLVHGAWGDHHNWDAVVPALAQAHRVLTYDRRGHSESERFPIPTSINEHVSDLAGLIQQLNLAPAHIVGSSFGASIVLKLATTHPELFLTASIHEPPLIGLLGESPLAEEVRGRMVAVAVRAQNGEMEGAAKQFFETVAFGPGVWEQLPDAARRKLAFNAPTFLDELDRADAFMLDVSELSQFDRPALLLQGDRSPAFLRPILDEIAVALPTSIRHTFAGAGHVPQLTHPGEFVRIVSDFVENGHRA
jgi:pimeloyl-ACP methyl ester carboxylesterase